MNILALDLGTRTGWALLFSGRVESGVQVFDVRRGESPGMRYVRFNRWLDDIARANSVDLIVYEAPLLRHVSGASAEIAHGFATRVMEFCSARGNVDHATVHLATLKKWVVGKGSADKYAMIAAVNRRWPRSTGMVLDDNEADAVALLHYGRAHYDGRSHDAAPGPRTGHPGVGR